MSFLPDKLYISLKYFYRFHKLPNLKDPQTYNEKLQWLKLNDHNELYHTLADKYEVKKYVEKLIGSEYIIRTLGIYDSFDEIDFENAKEDVIPFIKKTDVLDIWSKEFFKEISLNLESK